MLETQVAIFILKEIESTDDFLIDFERHLA